MYKKGIAVFAGLDDYSLNENKKYLKQAHDYGYEMVFSSAHINEAKKATEELQDIVDYSNELGMKLILDVSKPMMNNFVIPTSLYAIRLDYGFSKKDIVEMSHQVEPLIELNASTLKKVDLEELIDLGINRDKLRASFNYYPKKHTAHDIEDVFEKIALLHHFNIPVLVFLPSQSGKRAPIYEGLPSVESHRTMDLALAIEELKVAGADEIAFGDAYASIEEIKCLDVHQRDEVILNIDTVKNLDSSYIQLFDGVFKIRPDLNSRMIRITNKRGQMLFVPFNTVERTPYSVTVDNQLFGRYCGEIAINLVNLEVDERVNVIGYINATKFIIESLRRGQNFIIHLRGN